jgi:4-phospho-D-threonate 3-dehydrogenase / 4-phospho-D-erythronate 3-dehydrogenase
MADDDRPIVAVTMGDPAGVGPEIALRALCEPRVRQAVRAYVIGDPRQLARVAAACRLPLEIRVAAGAEDLHDDERVADVVAAGALEHVQVGTVRPEHAAAAVECIELAVAHARAGEAHALVTGPMNKEALKQTGSPYPGHTEMLAALFDVPAERTYTMFMVEDLRIFFLTRHHPLAVAIGLVTTESLRRALDDVDHLMRRLGFTAPRIAVAALNPHAGDHGVLGTEDDEIIRPAVESAAADGLNVVGPVPADSVFWQGRQRMHDAVISLYHDQGHVAAKTVDFFGTVSCTLGLPVIRTSAEHGTAMDIAPLWRAEPGGQVAAMLAAAALVRRASGGVIAG